MSDLDLFADDTDDAEAATLTQQTLVDTQQNLGKMLDLMPIGLLIHTEQGIVFANRQACSFLQTNPALLRGQHLLGAALQQRDPAAPLADGRKDAAARGSRCRQAVRRERQHRLDPPQQAGCRGRI